MILSRLGRQPTANSRERPLPGGENYPRDAAAVEAEWKRLAAGLGFSVSAIEAVWSLVGTRTGAVLSASVANASTPGDGSNLLAGTNFPVRFAGWSIRNESPTTLDDLIERRLMLLYEPRLSRTTLKQFARLLVAAGKLPPEKVDAAVTATEKRLARHFGKRIDP